MMVAHDADLNRAVLGHNVDVDDSQKTPAEPDHSYSCLSCGEELEYNKGPIDGPLDYFLHKDGDCTPAGNTSIDHRIGQEVVSAALYNGLAERTSEKIQIDMEKRIGGRSEFIISDVRISNPDKIAVEVVYQSSHIALRRRLKKIFANDYHMLLICIDNGRFNADRIQHHLQKISSIQIGRFNIRSFDLRLGSLITPDKIDPEMVSWDDLPGYLS